MAEIIWTAGADVDHQEIYVGLENQREGAGEAFMEEPDDLLGLRRRFPQMARVVSDPVRGLRIGDHHGLFYVFEARGVIIHSLLDLRQDPARIRERLARLID